jgi:hypothetical protein
MIETDRHPFPEVANWYDELESAEKDFREVLKEIAQEVWVSHRDFALLARRVLAKHPEQKRHD